MKADEELLFRLVSGTDENQRGMWERETAGRPLSRVDDLMRLLNQGRLLSNANIFLQYSNFVEWVVGQVANRFIANVATAQFPHLSAADAQVARARLTAGLEDAQFYSRVALELGSCLVSYISAVTPNRISDFYMMMGAIRAGPGSPAYTMRVGQTAIATLYVVPQAPGGWVKTPWGVIETLAGLVDQRAGAVQASVSRDSIKDAIDGVLSEMLIGLTVHSSNVGSPDNFTFLNTENAGSFSDWLGATRPYIHINPLNMRGVEVTGVDQQITYFYNPPNDRVLSWQPVNFRYSVKAEAAGLSYIAATINPAYRDLYAGGDTQSSGLIRVIVQDQGRPPPQLGPPKPLALPQPPVRLTLPPPTTPPPLIPLPAPAPPPKPPPLPAPPQPPPIPKFTPCGKPGDGGMTGLDGTCDYPK